MIGQLLKAASETPNPVFQETDLRNLGPEQFIHLKAAGLLRRGTDLAVDECIHVSSESRILTIVPLPGGGLEAIDLDDPGFPGVELSEADLTRWELDLAAIAGVFQHANQLSGRTERLADNVAYLGRKARGAAQAEFVLALLPPDDAHSSLLLADLKESLCIPSGHLVAICPSFHPTVDQQAWLSEREIEVVAPSQQDPFLIPVPERTERTGQPREGRLSDDFRQVFWDGRWMPLTPNQSRVVELLWGAREPLSQAHILESLEIRSQNLHQVFRGSWAWRTIVEKAPGQGMFALSSLIFH